MERLLLWWVGQPPDPNIPLLLWRGFRVDLLGWVLLSSVVTAVATVAIYAVRSRRLTVRSALDPFRPFTPLGWLSLAVVPSLVVFAIYWVQYDKLFESISRAPIVSPVGGATFTAIVVLLLTLALASVGTWLPGVTPRKFHYHPRWPMRLLRRRPS